MWDLQKEVLSWLDGFRRVLGRATNYLAHTKCCFGGHRFEVATLYFDGSAHATYIRWTRNGCAFDA